MPVFHDPSRGHYPAFTECCVTGGINLVSAQVYEQFCAQAFSIFWL